MKPQRALLGLLLVVVFVLSGCQSAPAAPPTAAPPATGASKAAQPTKQLRVAAVFPSTINDTAWSEALYVALKKVQQELGGDGAMKIVYTENMFSPVDAEAATRDYAAGSNDIIFVHGSGWDSFIPGIAKDYPNITFAYGTGVQTYADKGLSNVIAYKAEANQGGYVLGLIAAKMTKSGVIGEVGPVEAGSAKLFLDGFKMGAEASGSKVKVQTIYTGNWNDVTLAEKAAKTLTDSGADTLTGSSQIVVGAIQVAKDKGAFWFGDQVNHSKLAPKSMVASLVDDYAIILRDIMALRGKGVMGNKTYSLNLQNGGLRIEYNPDVPVPADVKAAADAAIKGIIDGKISTDLK